MGTLKPRSNTVIGTLTTDGWAVTFGTARRVPFSVAITRKVGLYTIA